MIKKVFFTIIFFKTTLFFSQNISLKKWAHGQEPNYFTNVDLEYPYSEQEYSNGNVHPIPALGSFIDLIDFYGEGRIVDPDGVTGFKKAYNISHQYQLVSNGPDLNRKIPNRIPVPSFYGSLNLSKYVRSNSVNNITLMGAPIQQNTAEEMARMVRKDGNGKIIIYGFDNSDPAITVLEKELKKIGFFYISSSILEPPFNEISGFQSPPRVYKNNKITVDGEKIFWSPNPKTNLNISQNDMATIDYGSLLKLNADLSGGIKGKINKPGGRIRITVYAYNEDYANGIQKFTEGNTSRDKVVYKIYSNVTDTINYVAKTSSIIYGFARNLDGSYRILGKTDSDNIKLLGSDSSSGWTDPGCSLNIVKVVRWLTWKMKSLFREHVPYQCQDVVTQIKTGTQPVIVEIAIKDATLYDYKIPGIEGKITNFIDVTGSTKEYKIIKKLKVTILESPDYFKSANYYKEKIGNQIKNVNAYYTGKTGNIKSTDIAAKIGNPRILFKNIELVLRKGSSESYDISLDSEMDELKEEVSLDENDDQTIPLIYAHALTGDSTGSIVLGYTYALGNMINNNHFCIFSYNSLFNTISNQGDPGSTVAHELGHYFNLLHPFQGGCSQTDGGDNVADTPPAEGPHWFVEMIGTPLQHLLENPCQNAPRTCNGQRRQVENIMDYGPCRWLFTQGQTDRMMERIRTKPTLFNSLQLYDSSIDTYQLNISVIDQRRSEPRKKRRVTRSIAFSIRMLNPDDTGTGNYTLEIVADKSETARIQIYDIYSNLVYENTIVITEGLNHISISPLLLKDNGLYLINYVHDNNNIERTKFIKY